VELPLLPVIDDLVAAEAPAHVVQQRPEPEVLGQLIDRHVLQSATGTDAALG
jgi:hypothetical protein